MFKQSVQKFYQDYFLKRLKRPGAGTQDMMSFYCTVIRPIMAYRGILLCGILVSLQNSHHRCNCYRKRRNADWTVRFSDATLSAVLPVSIHYLLLIDIIV